MKKIHLILILALCIIVAVLGIGYFAFGSDNDKPSDDSDKSFSSEEDTEDTEDTEDAEETEENYADFITHDENTTEQTTKKQDAEEIHTQAPSSEYEYAYAGFNPATAVINKEKWNLLLVNRNYILPDDFSVNKENVQGSSQQLDSRVVPYYNAMVNAAAKDGITLIPVSGYRSVERQRTNFERQINQYVNQGYSRAEATRLASEIVLMPATSEHNAGLAMDFGTTGNTSLEESFAETDAFQWLSENAADYGFILRYEKHTQDITMITYEPWHWRYVGEKAAKEIKASGVTLEEYLGMD